jgi:hypothetical protein
VGNGIFRMEMVVKVDEKVVAKLYLTESSNQQAASLVYPLDEGSKVKVQVGSIRVNEPLTLKLANENLSFFSVYFQNEQAKSA